MSPTRILIVAADPLSRTALAALLAAAEGLAVVGLTADSDDLVQACSVYRPDALLWDVGWRGDERLEALSNRIDLLPPVLAIAGADAAAALWASGVRGIVGRSANAQRLALALAAVADGLAVFEPTAGEEMQRPPVAVTSAPLPYPLESLTPRELDVLRALADGLSNKLIARALEISEHTVKYHVNSILAKLDAQSRTDAVVRATRAGILLL